MYSPAVSSRTASINASTVGAAAKAASNWAILASAATNTSDLVTNASLIGSTAGSIA